jgi:hypothetical protein
VISGKNAPFFSVLTPFELFWHHVGTKVTVWHRRLTEDWPKIDRRSIPNASKLLVGWSWPKNMPRRGRNSEKSAKNCNFRRFLAHFGQKVTVAQWPLWPTWGHPNFRNLTDRCILPYFIIRNHVECIITRNKLFLWKKSARNAVFLPFFDTCGKKLGTPAQKWGQKLWMEV